MSTPARGDAADRDEPATDAHPTEGHPTDGHPTDEQTSGQKATGQHTTDEEATAAAGAEPSGEDAEDDVRRKFREALARKQGHGTVGASGRNGPAGHAHTGAAKPQRQFRRKSG